MAAWGVGMGWCGRKDEKVAPGEALGVIHRVSLLPAWEGGGGCFLRN